MYKTLARVALFSLAMLGGRAAQATPAQELAAHWSVAPGYSLRTVATDLSMPSSLAAIEHPGPSPSSPKVFVTELRGAIKAIANDGSISPFGSVATFKPVAEWPGLDGEAGLAGICLDEEHGYVFVTYAYRDADGILRNAITRFSATPRTFEGPSSNRLELGQFFTTEPSALSHQIGTCRVHSGALYVAVGDAGNPALSGKPESPLGKILRLTLDGKPDPGNPFATGPGRAPYVYALGLRNPFGLAFAGDRLFAAENGVELDRFLEIAMGGDYHWDGTDGSIATNAGAVFVPTIGPVQQIFMPAGTGPLEPSEEDRFLIAASDGKQGPGIVVVDYDLKRNQVIRSPHHLVRYDGHSEGQAVTGVAVVGDSLYFVPIIPVAGTGLVLAVRYEPNVAHNRVIGITDGANLIAASGCRGCHSLGGVGGRVGPTLDPNSLKTRLETAVLNPEYAARVAKLDALTDPFIVAGRKARHEVLSTPEEQRVRVWIINRLLNPKFDFPNAQMPNFNLTRDKAERIAAELLGGPGGHDEYPKWKQVMTSPRYLAGVASGGLGTVTLVALGLFIQSRRRAKRAAAVAPA